MWVGRWVLGSFAVAAWIGSCVLVATTTGTLVGRRVSVGARATVVGTVVGSSTTVGLATVQLLNNSAVSTITKARADGFLCIACPFLSTLDLDVYQSDDLPLMLVPFLHSS